MQTSPCTCPPQREFEREGARRGGGALVAPVQRVEDYLEGGCRAGCGGFARVCLAEGGAGGPMGSWVRSSKQQRVCQGHGSASECCSRSIQPSPHTQPLRARPQAACPTRRRCRPAPTAWACAPRRCTTFTPSPCRPRCAWRLASLTGSCPGLPAAARGCCTAWRRGRARRCAWSGGTTTAAGAAHSRAARILVGCRLWRRRSALQAQGRRSMPCCSVSASWCCLL